MFINAREYLTAFAEPNVAEFRKDFANRRTALNAVLAVYHLSDWLYEANGGKDSPYWISLIPSRLPAPQSDTFRDRFNRYLASQCSYVETLRRVANGTKHMYGSKAGHIEPEVYKPEPTPWGPLGWPRDGSGMKQFPSLITVDHEGNKIDLYTALKKTIDWWPDFLATHGQ